MLSHSEIRTILVQTGGLSRTVRQSVRLPANVAAQVRSRAKTCRLSSNRMLVELIENGIEAEKHKQQEFFELAERFRSARDPEEVKCLGGKLGRWVFQRLMLEIAYWDDVPENGRQRLIDRMRDRAISIADLNRLRVWIECTAESPGRSLVQGLRFIQDLWSRLVSQDVPASWPGCERRGTLRSGSTHAYNSSWP